MHGCCPFSSLNRRVSPCNACAETGLILQLASRVPAPLACASRLLPNRPCLLLQPLPLTFPSLPASLPFPAFLPHPLPASLCRQGARCGSPAGTPKGGTRRSERRYTRGR